MITILLYAVTKIWECLAQEYDSAHDQVFHVDRVYTFVYLVLLDGVDEIFLCNEIQQLALTERVWK